MTVDDGPVSPIADHPSAGPGRILSGRAATLGGIALGCLLVAMLASAMVVSGGEPAAPSDPAHDQDQDHDQDHDHVEVDPLTDRPIVDPCEASPAMCGDRAGTATEPCDDPSMCGQVIPDGEDLEGGVDEAIDKAKRDNVMISCVGMGTHEGELIPLKGEEGKKGFLRDAEGNVVKTRLDEETMKKIALSTGGVYVRSTGAEFGLNLIYEEKLSKLEKQDIESKMEKQYNERFQLPLALAFVLLLLEPMLGDRRRED